MFSPRTYGALGVSQGTRAEWTMDSEMLWAQNHAHRTCTWPEL